VISLIYSTGFPPQSCPAGINLAGGTKELGAITAPFSILHPSNIIDLEPINASSSIIQE
jgi:hypothetical protein